MREIIDFSQMPKALEGLKKPVRFVEFKIGGTRMRIPRGADDPTPDHVLWFGGEPINVGSKPDPEQE